LVNSLVIDPVWVPRASAVQELVMAWRLIWGETVPGLKLSKIDDRARSRWKI
jgi:hypothetical protein